MPLKENSWLWPSKPGRCWTFASRVLVAVVGSYSKVWTGWLNRFRVYNKKIMLKAIDERAEDRGLITVSNHTSCMDDPFIWGAFIKWHHVLKADQMRWVLAAEDICYTKWIHSIVFTLGKTLPVCRGDGVYQKPVNFMVEQLDKGGLVHMFPEGKVNLNNEWMRLKWGVGRMIADCKKVPLVVPLWHIGMNEILPNKRPYIPRINKKVTILIGQPMEFGKDIQLLKELKKSPREIRKYITDKIQDELYSLKEKTEKIHFGRLNS